MKWIDIYSYDINSTSITGSDEMKPAYISIIHSITFSICLLSIILLRGFGYHSSFYEFFFYIIYLSMFFYICYFYKAKMTTSFNFILTIVFTLSLFLEFGIYGMYLSAIIDVRSNEKKYMLDIEINNNASVLLRTIDEYNSGPITSSAFYQIYYVSDDNTNFLDYTESGICKSSLWRIKKHYFYVQTIC